MQSPAPPTAAPVAADGRSTRWDHHRQQRRSELIRAARKAVHDLGPQASMDEIATHAGTSKSVFYRYFGDKNGLQVAVGQRAIEFMERELLDAAEASENALDGLYAMVSVYLRLAESSPHVYAFSTRMPPEAVDAAVQDGAQPAAMADFSDRIAAVMDVHFRTYLSQQGREPSEGSATWYWPRAAIGMVRAAGETWLAAAPGPGRPEADHLARKITSWLTAGLAGTYAPLPSPTPTPTPRQETS